MALGDVIKGSFWLYSGSLIFNLLGYLYWIVISLFVSPEIVGSAGAIISLYTTAVAIASLGIPTGIRRVLGEYWGTGDYNELKSAFFFSSRLIVLLNLPMIALLGILWVVGTGFLTFSTTDIAFALILLLLEFWPPMFYSLFNSTLHTKIIAVGDIFLSSLKLISSILLLSMGFGFFGVLLGLAIGSTARTLVFVVYTLRFFRKLSEKEHESERRFSPKETISAGLASWMPSALTIASQALGVLTVYGLSGGLQTGYYYLSFMISLVVYRLSDSIQTLMFPTMSGMKDGRKRISSKSIGMSLFVSLPLVSVLLTYPELPFAFLGSEYGPAAVPLRILIIGAALQPLVSGYVSYVYALSKYSHVTTIGLVTALTRISLYVLLIPPFGASGASLAYTLGILVSLFPVVFSARRMQYRFAWLRISELFALAFVLLLPFHFLSIPWVIGIPVLLGATAFLCGRLGLVTREDVTVTAHALMSEKSISILASKLRPVLDIIFGEY